MRPTDTTTVRGEAARRSSRDVECDDGDACTNACMNAACGDGIVYAEGYEASETADAAPTVRKYQSTRIRRGEGMGYAAHEEIFRRHHAEASDTSDDYAAYRPAYEYGYTYGNNPEFAGRDYAAVEPELRQDYERHHGSGSWGRVKAAARHAFEYARR